VGQLKKNKNRSGLLMTLRLKFGGLLFGPLCILLHVQRTLHKDFACHAKKADKYVTRTPLKPHYHRSLHSEAQHF